MTNNTATLIYHVGKSINKKLGAVDTKIYGAIQSKPELPQRKTTFGDFVIGFIGIIFLVAMAMVWLNRFDNLKRSIFEGKK